MPAIGLHSHAADHVLFAGGFGGGGGGGAGVYVLFGRRGITAGRGGGRGGGGCWAMMGWRVFGSNVRRTQKDEKAEEPNAYCEANQRSHRKPRRPFARGIDSVGKN